ncbi:MAG: helix-turn-helix transcriptional regulator [Cyclobacteriaceae bacterium]|nr:helix-turn-helix transcriptional regulator [Cyclobacteriaceae bacterium HetDA_MAG_MS6]
MTLRQNKVSHHHSISDLYRSLNIPVEQEVDFTIHSLLDLHQKIPFRSPTFRTDYYSFVFIKDGSGSYTTDNKTFRTTSGTIYFTNPGHLKSFEITSLREAYIITFTESFLKEQIHPNVFEEFPFLLAETVEPATLPLGEFKIYEQLYLQIKSEFENSSPYKYKVIGNLFVVLLLRIKERFWREYDPLKEGGRSSDIVRQFLKSLEKQYRNLTIGQRNTLWQVQDYAYEQELHPNYFGTVIKSKTGKSVNQWITEKTILEAQALLKNSSITAKQIGQHLGFSEPTHFSSYFKKYTGQTPNNFRKT